MSAAPLPNPKKITAICLNFLDHCREQNVPVPERPLIFPKFSSAIIGPGDLITTGTPYGVGVFRNPQVFLQNGDVFVVEIDAIGLLENQVNIL